MVGPRSWRAPADRHLRGAGRLPLRPCRAAPWGLFLGLTGWRLHDFDTTPLRIRTGLHRLGGVPGFMFPPHPWATWEAWREGQAALGETLAMAFLGTAPGAVATVPPCFRGARTIRAFETLIRARIFFRAIAVSEVGVFARFFPEAPENPSETLQAIRDAIMPQVLPVHLSFVLCSFRSSLRSSTIHGIVGAGGIDDLLSDRIAA